MKLLVFAHSGSFSGGAERSLFDLLCDWSETEAITVVCPSNGDFADACRDLGIRVVLLSELSPDISWASLCWCGPFELHTNDSENEERFSDCLQTLRCELGHQFDLVYTNTTISPLGAFFAAKANLPHVWHLREMIDADFDWDFALGKAGCYRLIEKLSAKVITISEALQEAIHPFFVDSSPVVIPNGPLRGAWLDEPGRSPEPAANPLNLCMLGHITEAKGQLTAIRAIERLRSWNVNCHLNLYGQEEPVYRSTLKRVAKEAGLENRVHFHGVTDNPRLAYLENDISLVCSRCEAFGRVTVEAMSTGMPVIGAASGATASLIENRRTGLLYSPDSVEDLAEKILWFDQHRPRIREMGAQAREFVLKEYSQDLYVQRMHALFQEIVEQKHLYVAQPESELIDLLMMSVGRNISNQANKKRVGEARRLQRIIEQSWCFKMKRGFQLILAARSWNDWRFIGNRLLRR